MKCPHCGCEIKNGPESECFSAFWSAYPKKRKKKQAEAIWRRDRLDRLADRIVEDVIMRQRQDGTWLAGYIPDPTTYLNGERWEDEIEPGRETAIQRLRRKNAVTEEELNAAWK